MVYGVDGCKGGWICAGLTRESGDAPTGYEFHLYDTFADCLAGTAGHIIVVDIPIGLLATAMAGGRPCDRLARVALGWPRRNSVFTPPARPALHATDYREAIRLNGRGMSQQTFRIIPKIREVDEAIKPEHQSWVFEGHPEMAFMRLAGAGIAESKREAAGQGRRRALIESELGLAIDPAATRARFGRGQLAYDDILDAMALTMTAAHIRDGKARVTPAFRAARDVRLTTTQSRRGGGGV